MSLRFRLFLEIGSGQSLQLSAEQLHYLKHVRRVRPGDLGEIITADQIFELRVLSIEGSLLTYESIKVTPKSVQIIPKVLLYQSMPKQDKFSDILRSCTELGLDSVVPVGSKRSVPTAPNEHKMIRWQRVLESASEQCQRLDVPYLYDYISFKEIAAHIQLFAPNTLKLMAWEEPDQKRVTLKSVLSKIPKPDQIMIFIGPEGGIDAQEAKILQRLGFHTVSLGETILRVEHAAFSMLSNILYEYSQGS